jgi:hypothetical protein
MTQIPVSLARRLTVLTMTVLLAGTAQTSAATTAPTVPLTPCVSTDNGDPVLRGVALDHRVLDTRDHAHALHVTVRARDTGGPGPAVGLAGGSVGLETDEGAFVSRRLHAGPDGTWKAAFSFPSHVGTTKWFLSASLVDQAGNTTDYSDAELRTLGLPSFVTVRSGPWRSPGFASLRFGRGPVDTRRHDARLPVRAVMTAWVPVGRVSLTASDGHGHHATATLRQVPRRPRVLRGHWLIQRFQTTRSWRVTSGVVTSTSPDFAFLVGAAELLRAGAHAFRVVSGPDDATAPTLLSFGSTPAQVDVTDSSQGITSTLVATDARSGVARVTLTHFLAQDPFEFRRVTSLHLTSGRGGHGTWTGTDVLEPCDASAGVWKTEIDAWDVSGNHLRLKPGDLDARGWPSLTSVVGADHVLGFPSASTDDRLAVTVRFPEPVTGIDEASVTVFQSPQMINDFEWSEPGPPVAGSWACQDALGDATDCATGTVTIAVFTVSGTGPWDSVELNPDHQLSVRDLDGNPFDHSTVEVVDNSFRDRARTLPGPDRRSPR